MPMYVDMHCHCNELSIKEIDRYIKNGYILVAVSEDWESIREVLEYYRKYPGKLIPCLGIHPWVIHRYSAEDAHRIVKLVLENDIKCLGEVGLDTIFVPKTIEHQRTIFRIFVDAAKEYGLILNLHTPGTWREVYEILIRNSIDRAYFHWYTGPLKLLEDIEATGYYIGANPAWRIQGKHRRILEHVSLDMVITESDAPYRYKGIMLRPEMVRDTIRFLAESRSMDFEEVRNRILSNAKKLLGFS